MGGGGGKVHIVVTGTGTYHNLELLGGIEYLGINHIATDDDGVDIGHGGKEIGLVAIFLQQYQLIAGCFNHFTDAIDRYLGKWLIGCY